jgi:trehalose-6-phosphate synthase
VIPVDPFDVDDQAAALERALELPEEDRVRRIEAIRSWVRGHDLDAWSDTILAAIEQAASTIRP